MNLQTIKQRFGIIGNSAALNRAITVAAQVAPVDITVLVTGESGVGKENMPKIIHHLSNRKHKPYIAVNCGAIPEGTIDSELFGHEKGSFTGATDARKGYFEEANGGTIFLDEVAELPLPTQVRLLRVLETGEFMRVGSSKALKTDVRVVAATNVNIPEAVRTGRFREDLYYRLNTVPIYMPPLRERKEDIHLLFRKFTTDFSEKYRMPPLELTPEAVALLESYRWPGNIRQLKNITEQISIIEQDREIDADTLLRYIPHEDISSVPMALGSAQAGPNFSEREILYKVLFDMKNDLTDLKKLVLQVMNRAVGTEDDDAVDPDLIHRVFGNEEMTLHRPEGGGFAVLPAVPLGSGPREIEVEETFSLQEKEKELIKKALKRHKNKRKYAALELGISERTLYRKINEYGLK